MMTTLSGSLCSGRPRPWCSRAAGPPYACQVTDLDDTRCPNPAEVKLADSLGDRAWVCLTHADEILVTVPRRSSPATTTGESPRS